MRLKSKIAKVYLVEEKGVEKIIVTQKEGFPRPLRFARVLEGAETRAPFQLTQDESTTELSPRSLSSFGASFDEKK